MNYKEKYEQALENFKKIKSANSDNKELVNFIEYEYPELRESEDERIRKEIIQSIQDNMCVIHKDKCIAWLEKKGEQKPIETDMEFKAGDWIVCFDNEGEISIPEKVVGFFGNKVRLVDIDGVFMTCPKSILKQYHLWTIQDAEDGDVLAVNNEVFIYAHRKQLYSIAVAHCFVDSAGGFYLDGEFGYMENGNLISLATKEQRDTLFAKMKEAGYEWDAGKKELKKIEHKSAWSEEDEKCFIELDTIIYQNSSLEDYNRLYNWLKSLKDRVQPLAKQEWSEEDEHYKNGLIGLVEDSKAGLPINLKGKAADKCIYWLKSRKPRWKPSDTQMSMLLAVLNDSNNISSESVQIALKSLYNDLKNL